MRLYCTNGHVYKTREFRRAPDETHCMEPGCNGRLQAGMERNAQKKASQRAGGLRDNSPAEVIARREFSRLVLEWPCWAKKHRPCERCEGRGFDEDTGEVCSICNGDGGHQCRGRKNAHHLIPVDTMRAIFSDLTEDEFLEIAFAPILGAPACQHNFHAALEARTEYIYFDELDPELPEFCERIDDRYRKSGRPSMLERLKLESPTKTRARG